MRRWLQDDRCRRPLPERAVDSAGVEDECDAPTHELPAERRAVGVAEIEIQDACRQIRVVRQAKGLVQLRRGGKVQADEWLVFDDQDGSPCQVQNSHKTLPQGL